MTQRVRVDYATAHPRSRGENRARQVAADGGHGSSPLTRGKHVIRESVNVWHGLIPAHAGKTRTAGDGGRAPGAHPRSRGENAATARVGPLERGSSPLTRGKHREADERRDTARLIPAHAGKTRCGLSTRARGRAHPRSRGENRRDGAAGPLERGSSPLTRGKPWPKTAASIAHRLIPAHAGKTVCVCQTVSRRTAHPRSRGENVHVEASGCPRAGSSPLTRGKLRGHRRRVRRERLIPAHAGKTSRRRRETTLSTAHPRSRGENTSCASVKVSCVGSSPLTRGKPSSEDRVP